MSTSNITLVTVKQRAAKQLQVHEKLKPAGDEPSIQGSLEADYSARGVSSAAGASVGVTFRACSKRKLRTFSVRIRDAMRPRVPSFSNRMRNAATASRSALAIRCKLPIDFFGGRVNRLHVRDLLEQQRSFDVLGCALALLFAEFVPIEFQ